MLLPFLRLLLLHLLLLPFVVAAVAIGSDAFADVAQSLYCMLSCCRCCHYCCFCCYCVAVVVVVVVVVVGCHRR